MFPDALFILLGELVFAERALVDDDAFGQLQGSSTLRAVRTAIDAYATWSKTHDNSDLVVMVFPMQALGAFLRSLVGRMLPHDEEHANGRRELDEADSAHQIEHGMISCRFDNVAGYDAADAETLGKGDDAHGYAYGCRAESGFGTYGEGDGGKCLENDADEQQNGNDRSCTERIHDRIGAHREYDCDEHTDQAGFEGDYLC